MLHVLLTCDLWVTCARSGPKCPPLQPFGKHPLRWQVTAVPLVWCTRHSAAVKLIWNLTIVVFEWFGVELLWNCGTSQCEHLASRHHKASRDTVWYSTVHQSDDTTGTEWLNWGRWLGDSTFFLRDGSWWICCFSLKPTRTCLNTAVSKWTSCYV